MGSIKRIRKKYTSPYQKWQKERIVEERALIKEYGLKNKTELWKHASALTHFKTLAKAAVSGMTAQSDKEGEELLAKLRNFGLLHDGSVLSDVLKLVDKDILERRLQTIVFRKGLARSVKQARQFITHGHIKLNGVLVSSPAYLVRKDEEDSISFVESSSLSDVEHPERSIKKKVDVTATDLTDAEKTSAKTSEKAPDTKNTSDVTEASDEASTDTTKKDE